MKATVRVQGRGAQRVGVDDPYGSLPSQGILYFMILIVVHVDSLFSMVGVHGSHWNYCVVNIL